MTREEKIIRQRLYILSLERKLENGKYKAIVSRYEREHFIDALLESGRTTKEELSKYFKKL